MITCYRIVNKRHAESAFDGEGAKLYGGRWNSKGLAAVYCSDSAALAMLEILVHLNDEAVMADWVIYRVEIPERSILMLRHEDIPENWLENPPPLSTRKIGDSWLEGKESFALSVPSATIPFDGRNIILNPNHRLAAKYLDNATANMLQIDSRLLGNGE